MTAEAGTRISVPRERQKYRNPLLYIKGKLWGRWGNHLSVLKWWPLSRYLAPKNRELFKGISIYCMFMGYGRSGSSLVGSLVDAHPNAIIALEGDPVRYLKAGFNRDQIFTVLLENSRRAARNKRNWSRYGYYVGGQWQGKFRKLSVIGDKKAHEISAVFASEPELIDRLIEIVGVEVRAIHVIRNPYDNITTIATRRAERYGEGTVEEAIARYFTLAEANVKLKDKLGDAVLDVRQEELVKNPKKELKKICEFLGLEPREDYLDACAGIVFKRPRKTREGIPWSPELIEEVKGRMEKIPFLKGYSYEG